MKAIQFYFNPDSKKEAIFESFCFSPENKMEQNLGRLYLVGQLENSLPQNKEMIRELAEAIKQSYYGVPFWEPEDCLKRALEKANEFLSQEIKKENTSWLGNLNFVVLTITPDLIVRVANIGKLKILFNRQDEVFNIAGEDINFSLTPNRVFPNVVEGISMTGDKILVLSESVFNSFEEQNLFQEISQLKKKKELKKNFKQRKESLKEFFGLCLFIFVKKPRRKIYLSLPKLLPGQKPDLLKKIILSLLLLIIILVLGYFIFQ